MHTFVVYHIKIKIRASVCTADGSTYVNFNRENLPLVNLHRYNKIYLYPKLKGYGANGAKNKSKWFHCGSRSV